MIARLLRSLRASVLRSLGSGFWPLSTVLWLLAGVAPALHAQQQFQGVCANVKIEIQQELALERIGFEATLEITNNLGGDPLTDFFAELTFTDNEHPDADGLPVDAASRFFVQPPRLTDITGIDGSGVIGPTKTAIIRWFIIPKPAAGGELPQGRRYDIGVRMSGKVAGEEVPHNVLFAVPDTITVKPEPQLEITYFQPRDVQGDDPFTVEVESPIPFTLGVLVKNSGFGPARSVRINSQQPKIVENKAGLLLIARLLGVRVNDSVLDESSLQVTLGDIQPGQTQKGAWDMITSLSGEFIEFKASYTHSAELGGLETSLIKSLEAHFIAREALNDDPGRDTVLDFLADTDRDALMLPDTLYESQGPILPVNHWPDASITTPLAGHTFTVTVDALTEGWGYVRLDDPGQAKFGFASVVRDDGKILSPRNVWTNVRYRPTDNAKLTYLNLFDKVAAPGVRTYTITYAPPPPDTTPPETRLRFSGQATESGGNFYITRDTQMYFTSEDASPVSIVYRFDDDADFRPALPFRITEPGAYRIFYYASDTAGNDEAPRTAVLVLEGAGPAFAGFDVISASLALTGDTLTFRDTRVEIDVSVGSSPVGVHATIDIFRGIRVWPQVQGVPVSPTPSTTTTLVVSGENVDFYRYRLGGGAWSSERTVGSPLTLTELSGAVSVAILARSEHGGYPPESEALTVGWTVDPAAPPFTVAGLPPTPTRYLPGTFTVTAPGVELYRWSPNNSFYRAEAAPGTSFSFPVTAPGEQKLALIARRAGVWQAESAASTRTWLYDPAYGSDMSSLPLVYTASYSEIEGSSFTFQWNGRSTAGLVQPPGWFTVRIRLTDDLGNVTYRHQLVRIEELVTSPAEFAGPAAGAEKPHARGGWLVWQERATGAPNIHAQHVGDPGSSPLTLTTSALAQENPRTDGRHAVWQARQENGSTDILLVDLTAPAAITPVTSTPTRNEINPVIDWPWVVFQAKDLATPSARWQLEAVNLETAQRFTVSPTAADQLDPALQAGRVVWQDFRDVGFGEIYFRDLESGEQRRITTNSFGQYAPDLDGHWIVWQDNRHTQVELYGFDLRRRAETRLTTTPLANEARPRLAGSWVLYTEDSTGPSTDNFALLDLGTLRAAPLTRSATAKSHGAIAAGRLYWQTGTSGATTLESAAVPALQPVFNNTNAVAVSAALAGAHTDAYSLLTAWHAAAGVTTITRFQSLAPLVLETATWAGGAPTGDNFALAAGDFVWVRFASGAVLDLGAASGDALDLPAGVSAFSHTQIPPGTTGHDLVSSLGLANVRGLRVLDAETGRWRVLAVAGGAIQGADFPVPTVAVVLVELINPVEGWTP